MTEFKELNENQLKQITNSDQLYQAYIQSRQRQVAHAGSMIWRSQNGKDYLVKTSARGNQTGMGPRNAETEAIFGQFMRAKEEAHQNWLGTLAALKEAVAINRVYGAGRTPNLIVEILSALGEQGLGGHFMIIGTNALYAYETHCGVRFEDKITATADLDMLWDSRKSIQIAVTENIKEHGFLGILKKADKSFELLEDQRYTAINQTGFMVDLLHSGNRKRKPESLQLFKNPDDFWAVEAPNIDWLLSAPKFTQTVISANGKFARMVTVDPRAFVIYKNWLSQRVDRDPTKKPRDLAQSKAVALLLEEYMPHFPTNGINHFPKAIRLDL
jgi:hypothetical protein